MKLSTPYKCDYCDRLKGETNHWWLLATGQPGFFLDRWDAILAEDRLVKHICSEQCASKALSRFMAAITGGVVPK